LSPYDGARFIELYCLRNPLRCEKADSKGKEKAAKNSGEWVNTEVLTICDLPEAATRYAAHNNLFRGILCLPAACNGRLRFGRLY